MAYLFTFLKISFICTVALRDFISLYEFYNQYNECVAQHPYHD